MQIKLNENDGKTEHKALSKLFGKFFFVSIVVVHKIFKIHGDESWESLVSFDEICCRKLFNVPQTHAKGEKFAFVITV